MPRVVQEEFSIHLGSPALLKKEEVVLLSEEAFCTQLSREGGGAAAAHCVQTASTVSCSWHSKAHPTCLRCAQKRGTKKRSSNSDEAGVPFMTSKSPRKI